MCLSCVVILVFVYICANFRTGLPSDLILQNVLSGNRSGLLLQAYVVYIIQ